MAEAPGNFERLKTILGMMDEGLTKKDFVRSFKNVVEIVLKISKRLDTNYAQMKTDFDALAQRFAEDRVTDLASIKADAQSLITVTIKKMVDDCEAKMGEMDGKMDDYDAVKDREADKAMILADLKALLPTLAPAETATGVRDLLERLSGDERLDLSAIKGGKELEAKLIEAGKVGLPVRMGFGRTGMYIFVGGVKVGVVNMVDFVPGSGMAIAYSKINGRTTLTFTASAAGSTVETPTGAVNGSNTQFTPTSKPQYVVSDGTTYFENNGYTWDGTHINMTIAPSAFIRDVY